MLRLSYDSQDAIPENLRGAYVQKDGRFVLDELDSSHPILVNNRALKGEKESAQSEVERLTRDLSSARGSSIPSGYAAVPKEEADALKALSESGVSLKDVPTVIGEHKTLKARDAERTRKEHLRAVATAHGWNPEAFENLPGLPEIELRDAKEAGKDVKRGVVRVEEGGVTKEKPLQEFLESSERHKPLMPALQPPERQGTQFVRQTAGGQKPSVNPYERVREEVRESQKNTSARGPGWLNQKFKRGATTA